MAEYPIDRQQAMLTFKHSPDCSVSRQPPPDAIQHIQKFSEDVKRLDS